MSDESLASRIERLAAEEHELLAREQPDSLSAERLEADPERLSAPGDKA